MGSITVKLNRPLSTSPSSSSRSYINPDPIIKTPLGEISWYEGLDNKLHRWTQKSIVKEEECFLWERFLYYLFLIRFDNKRTWRWGRDATLKFITQATVNRLRNNLFETARNNFRVPMKRTFTFSTHLIKACKPDLAPIYRPFRDMMVYMEVDTERCQRKLGKCLVCKVRYRCITEKDE